MNWAPDWVTSSSNACEFVVGQIIACTEAGTTLMLLTQVRGYRCVFKSDKKKDFDLMIPSGREFGVVLQSHLLLPDQRKKWHAPGLL